MYYKRLVSLILLTVFGLVLLPQRSLAEYTPDNANKPDPMQLQKQLQNNLSVGEFTGAAIYEYPISLPSGRNGMQPSVAFTYNSQDESLDYIAGYHWSLTEYSIKRINKDGVEKMYSENYFVASTPFEGGELVPVQLSDEHHGIYGQKVESQFGKYEYLSDGGWAVTDKFGTRYLFGTSDEFRQFDPADSTRVYSWMLQEIRDRNDNWVRFSYYKADNRIYPKEITYTGHGEEEGIMKVRFLPFADNQTGTARADGYFSYASGFRVASRYLVTSVEVLADNKLRRKYEMAYATAAPLVRQTLGSVLETGYDAEGNAMALPPTTFGYTPSAVSWEEAADYSPPMTLGYCDNIYGCHSGQADEWDMNGDGLVDFEYYDDYSPQAKRATNDGKGGWAVSNASYLSGPPGYNNFIPSVNTKPVDFDGDGRTDIVASGINADHTLASSINLANGSSYTNSISVGFSWPEPFCNDNGASIADLNGDGLPDAIQSKGYYGVIDHATCLNQNGNSCQASSLWPAPMYFTAIGSQCYSQARNVYVQDCNYDGLADVYYSGSGAGTWVNDGKGGWKTDESCHFTQMDSMTRRSFDANGDGLIDNLISENLVYTTTNELHINLGNNQDHVYNFVFPVILGYFSNNTVDNGVRVLDLNGDNLPDVMQSFQNFNVNTGVYTYAKKVYMNRGSRPYFLKTVHASSGAVMNLEYKTSAQYMKENGTQANPNLPMVITTVSKVSTDDGLGNILSSDYFYEDGNYYFNNSYDKQFAGFRVVTKTDRLGYKTKSYYHQSQTSVADMANGEYQDHIAKKGRPYRTEIYDNANRLVQANMNKWDNREIATNHYYPFLAQSVSKLINPDTGTAKANAQAYEYDARGNVLRAIDYGEVQAGNDGTFTDVGNDLVQSEQTYALDEADYLVGLVSERKTSDQSGHIMSDDRLYYDNLPLGEVTKGNATRQESWLDTDGSWIATTVAYNEYGLSVSQTNPRGYTASTTYDSYHLYPETVTNAKGQTVQMAYDIGTGNMLSQIDPNNLRAENKYDGLGRLLEARKADLSGSGNMVTTQTVSYNDTSMPRAVTQTVFDGTNSISSYSYSDGLGRAIEQKRQFPEGQWVTAGTVFDERGNAKKTLQPYFSSSSSFEPVDVNGLGNAFAYDALGRVLTVTNPLGVTANRYDGWETEVTDPDGHIKKYAYDARGNLIRVDEKNGAQTHSTNYSYDPLGRLVLIKDATGNERDFAYNSLGQRVMQTGAKRFGTWRYEYDANGNLVKRVNPNNHDIVWSYDELDRPLTEDSEATPDIDLSYAYDQNANGIGRLSEITSPNYSHGFTYDLWGRPVADKKTIGGREFIFRYAYDLMGGITALTYPDDSVVDYAYDNSHLLSRVSSNGKTFAEGFHYTPLGQVAEMSLGNGVVTTNTYDPNQMYRLTDKTSLLHGVVKLQKYQYQFDPVGNLLKLTDKNNGMTSKVVTYEYDPLDRLMEARFTETANYQFVVENYQYDSIGNMTFKSDVGAYKYESQNPHAVTKAGNQNFAYDTNGNMVTRNGEAVSYDYRDRMTQSGNKVSFAYGEGYDRVSKTNLQTGVVRYYPNEYYEVEANRETKYIFAGKMRIAKVDKIIVEPPIVHEVGEVTDASYTFTGTKASELALWVGENEVMSAGPETEWAYTADLAVGDNNFEFYTKEVSGAESKRVAKTVHYEVTAPTVNFVDSPVTSTRVLLSGTKRANTSVWINNAEAVPMDDQAAWQYEVRLPLENNVFEILSKDRLGNASSSVRQEIRYIAMPPVVENVIQPVHQNPLVIRGTKVADMAILLNGAETVPMDGKTDWQAAVTLTKGINNLEIKAKNEFGLESSTINLVIPYDVNAPSVDAIESPTHETAITLSGTKPPFTGVWINGEEQVQLNSEEVWGYTVAITAEDNTFEIFTKDEAGQESEKVTVSIRYAAQMPTIDTLPSAITYSPYTLSGTKAKGTGIWINENNAVPVDNATVWVYALPLNAGENPIELWAESGFSVKSEKTSASITYQPATNTTVTTNVTNSNTGGGYSSSPFIPEAVRLRLKELAEQQEDKDVVAQAKKAELDLSQPGAIAKCIVKNMSAPVWMIPKNLRPKVTPMTDVEFKDIKVAYSEGRAVITWAQMSREVAKFKIYRGKEPYPAGKSASVPLTEVTAGAEENRFVDEHKEKGKYIYQIVALNHNGDILKVSIPLTPQLIFVDAGRGSRISFADYSAIPFVKVAIAKHSYLDFKETNDPKTMRLVPKNGFAAGTKIEVNFLMCAAKKNGKESCQKVDGKVLDVFVSK